MASDDVPKAANTKVQSNESTAGWHFGRARNLKFAVSRSPNYPLVMTNIAIENGSL